MSTNKLLVAAVAVFASALTFAQTSMQLPQAPFAQGQDRVSVNGFECSSSLASRKNFEVGMVAQQAAYPTTTSIAGVGYTTQYGVPAGTGGIYARITIPLDKEVARPDCNRLYELEVAKRELEFELMKRDLATPQDNQFKK